MPRCAAGAPPPSSCSPSMRCRRRPAWRPTQTRSRPTPPEPATRTPRMIAHPAAGVGSPDLRRPLSLVSSTDPACPSRLRSASLTVSGSTRGPAPSATPALHPQLHPQLQPQHETPNHNNTGPSLTLRSAQRRPKLRSSAPGRLALAGEKQFLAARLHLVANRVPIAKQAQSRL